MYRFLWIIFWPFVRLFFPTKVIGKKSLSKKENYIFLMNHRSNFDSIILGACFFRKFFFLAKKELFSKKLRSKFLKSMGAISIDRKSIDITAIKQATQVLKNGKNLVVFPEGTRNHGDDIQEIKNGAAMFSIKTKTRIVPLYLRTKPAFLRSNRLFVGEPFSLDEFVSKRLDKETLSRASEIITTKLLENKQS